MSRTRVASVLALAAVLLAACAQSGVVAPLGRAPPRGEKAPARSHAFHRVHRGETLYSIAWRHGLDYRDVARWNGIPDPYLIFEGQRLRLTRPARLPPLRSAEAPPARGAPRAARKPRAVSPRDTTTARAAPRESTRPVRGWRWPARGRVVAGFGKSGGNGIDIAGKRGGPVMAAAPGRVVYSGSGLRGYGKLIIVKHNKRYLSAYAHNDSVHVKEGEIVTSGQRIADMGSTGTKTVKLHFEIRRDGKPVDPMRFLPKEPRT